MLSYGDKIQGISATSVMLLFRYFSGNVTHSLSLSRRQSLPSPFHPVHGRGEGTQGAHYCSQPSRNTHPTTGRTPSSHVPREAINSGKRERRHEAVKVCPLESTKRWLAATSNRRKVTSNRIPVLAFRRFFTNPLLYRAPGRPPSSQRR